MLRITKVDESQTHVTLRVEGKILSRWVTELEREAGRWLRSDRRVVLDFAGVQFVGSQGADMLKRVTTKNVQIINCSALIKGLLCGSDQP